MQGHDWSHAAEAHDIGKLFVKRVKHNLKDMLGELKRQGVREESPVMQSILKHHCTKDMQLYPDSYETLLVHLADILASQASRILRKLRERLKTRNKSLCI